MCHCLQCDSRSIRGAVSLFQLAMVSCLELGVICLRRSHVEATFSWLPAMQPGSTDGTRDLASVSEHVVYMFMCAFQERVSSQTDKLSLLFRDLHVLHFFIHTRVVTSTMFWLV